MIDAGTRLLLVVLQAIDIVNFIMVSLFFF